jgi:putative component of membrane protein insertase Oxa1/YidC/SpoIIIJ protein YidD
MQNDIDLFRNEYRRQKKLEKIVLSRKLTRPQTKKWEVIVVFAIFLCLFVMAVFITTVTETNTVYKILFLVGLLIFIFEVYFRFCLILTVKCYQHYASKEVRRRCLCVPSCSEYAIISLKKYPLISALIKIRKRLYKTCKGEEYKLDFPSKSMNARFEKKYL